MQYSLNYSGTRFCPLKIKITQFPGGFCVNLSHIIVKAHYSDTFESGLPLPVVTRSRKLNEDFLTR